MPEPQEETTTKARDFRQEVTDNLVALLEKGVAPWQKPWSASAHSGLPINPTTEKAYRGGNAIHLLVVGLQRGYEDPRWMTYKQASEQEWQVRKGEKGTQIEFWDVQPQKAEPTLAGTKSQPENSEQAEPPRLIHRVYTVFNARQMEGIPPLVPKEPKPFEMIEAGERILRNSEAKIAHDQADRAFYDRKADSIHLPPKEVFQDPGAYYGTALHELAHWTGHPNRLNRPTLTDSYRFGDTNYAKEELRAELASVFLAAEKGIPHDPNSHAAYVGSWIATLKNDKNEIFRAAHDASKAVDFVLALERNTSIADQALTVGVGPEAASGGTSKAETLRQESADLNRDRDEIGETEMPSFVAVPSEALSTGPVLDGYRAEYRQVLQRGDGFEISKMDKEARQFYVVNVPAKSFSQYRSEGRPLAEALPGLPDHQAAFLSTGLTPAEQQIMRDPAYHQAVDELMKASPAAFKAERTDLLKSAHSSQVEPYDYQLSLRHQAFNAALKQLPDVNSSIREVDWIKEIAPAQYQAQLRRDPMFNPDKRLSPAPAWTREQLQEQLRSIQEPARAHSMEASPGISQMAALPQETARSDHERGPVSNERTLLQAVDSHNPGARKEDKIAVHFVRNAFEPRGYVGTSYGPPQVEDALDRAFRTFNGMEEGIEFEGPSASVGDFFVAEGKTYEIAPTGFRLSKEFVMDGTTLEHVKSPAAHKLGSLPGQSEEKSTQTLASLFQPGDKVMAYEPYYYGGKPRPDPWRPGIVQSLYHNDQVISYTRGNEFNGNQSVEDASKGSLRHPTPQELQQFSVEFSNLEYKQRTGLDKADQKSSSRGKAESSLPTEAQIENSRFTARYESGSATVNVHDNQTATDRRTSVSTDLGSTNASSQAAPAKVPTEAFQTEAKNAAYVYSYAVKGGQEQWKWQKEGTLVWATAPTEAEAIRRIQADAQKQGFIPQIKDVSLIRPGQSKEEPNRSSPSSRIPYAEIAPDSFREGSALTAQLLGKQATMYRAQVESGSYRGPVIGETPELFLQRLSPRTVIAHPKELFDHAPSTGANISVHYSQSKPTVHELKERGKVLSMAR